MQEGPAYYPSQLAYICKELIDLTGGSTMGKTYMKQGYHGFAIPNQLCYAKWKSYHVWHSMIDRG